MRFWFCSIFSDNLVIIFAGSSVGVMELMEGLTYQCTVGEAQGIPGIWAAGPVDEPVNQPQKLVLTVSSICLSLILMGWWFELTTNSSFYWGLRPPTRTKADQMKETPGTLERPRAELPYFDEVRWFVRRWRRSTQSPDTTSSGDGWSQRAWSIAEQDGKKHMRSMLRHAKTQHFLYVSHDLKKCVRYFTRLVITGLFYRSAGLTGAAFTDQGMLPGMVLDQSHTVSFATTRQPATSVLDSTVRPWSQPTSQKTSWDSEAWKMAYHIYIYIYVYVYIYIYTYKLM